jgi:hypothetical protein
MPATPFLAVDVVTEPFYNVDHAALGTGMSLIYGDAEGRCGFTDAVWPADTAPVGSDWVPPDQGVLIGMRDGAGLRLMPFVAKTRVPDAAWIGAGEVRRALTPCVDTLEMPGLTVSHYAALPRMRDWETASANERRRFALPATWVRFVAPAGRRVLFGVGIRGQAQAGDGLTIVCYGANFIATGAPGARAEQLAGGTVLSLDAGTAGLDAVVIVGRWDARRFVLEQAGYAAAQLYASPEEIAREALAAFDAMRSACAETDAESASLSPERRWMSAMALHTYRANTLLLLGRSGRPLWVEVEGNYRYLNTLDLTADHVFLHDRYFPWATREVLDLFAERYATHSGGTIAFEHDMGKDDFSEHTQVYTGSMRREELLNWILCAAVYGRREEGRPWLRQRRAVLEACAASLKGAAGPDEITTYDSLGRSMRELPGNPYVAVKTYAAWMALRRMMLSVGDESVAADYRKQADAACAAAVALLDHPDTSVLAALEPLALLALIEPDALSGDNPLIQQLRKYARDRLVPGAWIEPDTHAWRITPDSSLTWLSKVYLCQFVAEKVLALPGGAGPASDAAHATMIWRASPRGWSDQIDPRQGVTRGSFHYPRGVTSVVWWAAPTSDGGMPRDH